MRCLGVRPSVPESCNVASIAFPLPVSFRHQSMWRSFHNRANLLCLVPLLHIRGNDACITKLIHWHTQTQITQSGARTKNAERAPRTSLKQIWTDSRPSRQKTSWIIPYVPTFFGNNTNTNFNRIDDNVAIGWASLGTLHCSLDTTTKALNTITHLTHARRHPYTLSHVFFSCAVLLVSCYIGRPVHSARCQRRWVGPPHTVP